MLFDRVIANPPFSLDQWGREVAENDPYGRFRFGVPPKTKGDLAFVQHMVATLNIHGKLGVVMPNGMLFRGSSEGKDPSGPDRGGSDRGGRGFAVEFVLWHGHSGLYPGDQPGERRKHCLLPRHRMARRGTCKESARLQRHHTTDGERRIIRDRFCVPDDPLEIIIVCDMLLTGFDAPVEQVMYLDSPLKEHTLLQAIARVNRTADNKTYGLVVDYWGVSEALQAALAIFSPSDVESAMVPKSDELPRLRTRHAAALRFFNRVRNKDDQDRCVRVLEPEDVRAEFQIAFRRFSQSLDMLLPDTRAMDYADDLRWLGKIRMAARARFRDRSLDISDCGDKVLRLIEDAVVADGVRLLVKQVSILSGDFETKIKSLPSDDARASEMEHGIRASVLPRLSTARLAGSSTANIASASCRPPPARGSW